MGPTPSRWGRLPYHDPTRDKHSGKEQAVTVTLLTGHIGYPTLATVAHLPMPQRSPLPPPHRVQRSCQIRLPKLPYLTDTCYPTHAIVVTLSRHPPVTLPRPHPAPRRRQTGYQSYPT